MRNILPAVPLSGHIFQSFPHARGCAPWVALSTSAFLAPAFKFSFASSGYNLKERPVRIARRRTPSSVTGFAEIAAPCRRFAGTYSRSLSCTSIVQKRVSLSLSLIWSPETGRRLYEREAATPERRIRPLSNAATRRGKPFPAASSSADRLCTKRPWQIRVGSPRRR